MFWDVTLTRNNLRNHLSHISKQEELIQQLLLPKQLMMIAGQFGIGKTNELLHLMCCFACEGRWHGLKVDPAICLYMTWEGAPEKINERIKIIEAQYAEEKYPWFIRFVTKRMPLDLEQGRSELSRIVTDIQPKPAVVILDPFKRSVSSDYSRPDIAERWIEGANAVAKALDITIITGNHTNKIIYRTDTTPDVLNADRVKGAGDLLDGVDTALLFAEEKGYRRLKGEMGYSKTEWALMGIVIKVLKARDAIASFPLLKGQFSHEKLRFVGEKWVVNANGEVLAVNEENPTN